VNIIFTIPKCLILLSLIPYAIFHIAQCKKKDERDEYIALKSFKVVQRIMLIALFILAIVNFFHRQLNPQLILTVAILSGLYSEIFAKLYYAKKY
jgi:uncharacterized membrane-anchored protein